MEKIIKELQELKEEYQKFVDEYEERGIDSLDYEETESYGAYLGKVDLCNYLINKYNN